jgi:hypothetical protein
VIGKLEFSMWQRKINSAPKNETPPGLAGLYLEV